MSLEVGKLVARLELEGSFAKGLADARAALEATTASAKDLDSAMEGAGRSGKALDSSTKSAKEFGTALDSAGKKGKDLDVSDKASGKLLRLNSTTKDYGVALKAASDAGRNLDVSDKASGKLSRLNNDARTLDGALQKATNTGRSLDVNDAATGKLSSMSSMAEQLDAKLSSAGISMGALMGAAAGGTAVGAVFTKGWDRFTAIDDAQKKLSGLGHETQSVATIMDSALSSVRGTAYGLGDAATISASAVAAGIKPGKELTKYLTTTADAAAIAGVDLSQMGRILNQVTTAQVAYTGDLNQLADRGIPVYQWLAEEAGVSAAEIKNLASTGQISSQMLMSAIEKNIGGAAKTMGESVTGAIANVGAAFGRFGASVITPFKGAITEGASIATDFADTMANTLGPAFTAVGSGVSKAVGLFGQMPAPIQAVTAAFVAMRIKGVQLLVAALGSGLSAAATAAMTGMSTLAMGTLSYTLRATQALGATGTLRGALGTLGTAAAGAGAKLGTAFVAAGGPLYAIAGAVTGVISAYKRTQAAQDAYAAGNEIIESSQQSLNDTLASTANVLDEQVTQAMIAATQSVVDANRRMAEDATGAWDILDGPLHKIRNDYDALTNSVQNQAHMQDYAQVQNNLARLEMQALGDATAAVGVEVDDAAAIAMRGGSQWAQLKQELHNTGSAGEAMASKLESAANAARRTQEAAESATDGSAQLAEAFRLMGDEAASADEKANALKVALDALSGGQISADDAIQRHNDSLRQLNEELANIDPAKGYGDELIGLGGKLDTTTENGSKLRSTISGMVDDLTQMAGAGAPIDGALAQNMESLYAFGDAAGISREQIDEFAKAQGLIKEVIQTSVDMVGGDEATAELAALKVMLDQSLDGSVEINPDNIDLTRGLLEELDFEVTSLSNGNVRVEAETDEAKADLAGITMVAAEVGSIDEAVTVWTNAKSAADEIRAAGFEATILPDGTVDISTNSDAEIAKIQGLGYAVDTIPDGNVYITDTSEENMARLRELNIATVTLDNGDVIITDTTPQNMQNLANLDIEVRKGRSSHVNITDNVPEVVARKDTLKTSTSSTHNVYVKVHRNYSSVDSAGVAVGQHYADGGIRESYAQGGISKLESYAQGGDPYGITGNLPVSATIQAPRGKRGLVQWAEDETEGEAFIPLAKSKRNRSRDIWIETGKRLGMLDGKVGDLGLVASRLNSFADGGIMAGGLIDFAKGVDGKPYVWGGVNFGDCSGAVSALANYVSGRPVFGSRFTTMTGRSELASRGFLPGLGGPGSLDVGWFNGGAGGGHMVATLPDGTNFEMRGGGRGGIFGKDAEGAADGRYVEKAHWPAERFADIDNAIMGGVEGDIAKYLEAGGGGDPTNMPAKPDTRTKRQKNIDAIVAEGQRRNLSDRDIQIALMTAEQESGIRVLNNPADAPSMAMDAEGTGYDGTSTGIFQQQNNGGWGTLEERMDPTKSAGMFYDALEKVEGRDNMALTAVAQKVQGSAHPDAYAKWEGKSGEELAASKKRLTELKSQASGSSGGEGARVFVTNWPGGASSSFSSSATKAIGDAEKAVGDAEEAAFVKDASIAALFANAAGRSDLIQKGDGGVSVTAYANGGFHGLENHSAHIAPAGSWRVFGEPETGGEAYIPLANSKRARSLDIWRETGRRFGYTGLGLAGLVGSALTGNGLDTGWNGPSLDDLGIDKGALGESMAEGVAERAAQAGKQVAAILADLGATIESSVDGTLKQANAGHMKARQQYARALI